MRNFYFSGRIFVGGDYHHHKTEESVDMSLDFILSGLRRISSIPECDFLSYAHHAEGVNVETGKPYKAHVHIFFVLSKNIRFDTLKKDFWWSMGVELAGKYKRSSPALCLDYIARRNKYADKTGLLSYVILKGSESGLSGYGSGDEQGEKEFDEKVLDIFGNISNGSSYYDILKKYPSIAFRYQRQVLVLIEMEEKRLEQIEIGKEMLEHQRRRNEWLARCPSSDDVKMKLFDEWDTNMSRLSRVEKYIDSGYASEQAYRQYEYLISRQEIVKREIDEICNDKNLFGSDAKEIDAGGALF